MKKSVKAIIKAIIAVLILTSLTSCSTSKANASNDDTVKVWYYKRPGSIISEGIGTITNYLKPYAQKNNIKLEIVSYTSDEMNYEDYVLKRNAALAQGEVDIILDDASNLYPIRKQAGDYTKLSTYDDIMESFKGYYCIPVCYDMRAMNMNNDVLEHYGLEKKLAVNLKEYYDIKQQLKSKGAKFRLNTEELKELIDYYALKNELAVSVDNGKYSVDSDLIKQTIVQIHEDITTYYDKEDVAKLNNTVNEFVDEWALDDSNVYEKNMAVNFYEALMLFPSAIHQRNYSHENKTVLKNYGVVIMDTDYLYRINAPCLFINKNSKKENTYKIASALFDKDCQMTISEYLNSPVVDSDDIREHVGFDADWKYVGGDNMTDGYSENKERIIQMMTKSYDILRNGNFKGYFEDKYFEDSLKEFVRKEILSEIGRTDLSGKLSGSIDDRLNDYIINLNMRYN